MIWNNVTEIQQQIKRQTVDNISNFRANQRDTLIMTWQQLGYIFCHVRTALLAVDIVFTDTIICSPHRMTRASAFNVRYRKCKNYSQSRN